MLKAEALLMLCLLSAVTCCSQNQNERSADLSSPSTLLTEEDGVLSG